MWYLFKYHKIACKQDPDESCKNLCEKIRYKAFDNLPDCTKTCKNNFVSDECRLCANIEFVICVYIKTERNFYHLSGLFCNEKVFLRLITCVNVYFFQI